MTNDVETQRALALNVIATRFADASITEETRLDSLNLDELHLQELDLDLSKAFDTDFELHGGLETVGDIVDVVLKELGDKRPINQF